MDSTDIHVIDFNPDGSVEAMCREDVMPLNFLGSQQIRRASDIKFTDPEGWEIWLADPQGDGFLAPTSPHARGFTTYDDARRAEVLWLERCRLHSVDPTAREGALVLEGVRVYSIPN